MAANKRTRFEIERDRTRIAHLYLTRMPQGEIADMLGTTQQMVSYDLAAIKREWKKARIRDFDADLNRELARVDALELEYWEAWRASKRDREVVTTETAGADAERAGGDARGGTPTSGPVVRTVSRREGQTGNPAFLAGVQWCIDRRIKLLGLDAPLKIAPTNPDGDRPWDGMTEEEKVAAFLSVVRVARERQRGAIQSGEVPLARNPN